MKDIVIFAASFYLLKQDVARVAYSMGVRLSIERQLEGAHVRIPDSAQRGLNSPIVERSKRLARLGRMEALRRVAAGLKPCLTFAAEKCAAPQTVRKKKAPAGKAPRALH